jgi:hypothetical protein
MAKLCVVGLAAGFIASFIGTRADESPPDPEKDEVHGLYGIMLGNAAVGPGSTTDLVKIDHTSGNISKVIYKGLPASLGFDDMSVVVDGVYFTLGAGNHTATPTILGVDLETGTIKCTAPVTELAPIAFVGVGESLDYDEEDEKLVISGLFVNKSAPAGQNTVHKVVSVSAISRIQCATCIPHYGQKSFLCSIFCLNDPPQTSGAGLWPVQAGR